MITTLLAVIAGLGGFSIFSWFKGKSAEALNTNLQVEQKVNTIDTTVSKDQGTLQSEADKRTQIQQQSQKQEVTKDSIQDLTDFLNRKPGE